MPTRPDERRPGGAVQREAAAHGPPLEVLGPLHLLLELDEVRPVAVRVDRPDEALPLRGVRDDEAREQDRVLHTWLAFESEFAENRKSKAQDNIAF